MSPTYMFDIVLLIRTRYSAVHGNAEIPYGEVRLKKRVEMREFLGVLGQQRHLAPLEFAQQALVHDSGKWGKIKLN